MKGSILHIDMLEGVLVIICTGDALKLLLLMCERQPGHMLINHSTSNELNNDLLVCLVAVYGQKRYSVGGTYYYYIIGMLF